MQIDKSVHENAGIYFDKAKKAKRKTAGAKDAVERAKKKLAKLENEGPKDIADVGVKRRTKKEWYEKFRWFYSSEGFLVIGGRDATTNEIVIKKYTDNDDLVFHTDMAGSPFFVVKSEKKKIGDVTRQETADATASFSRAWKKGLGSTDVFFVLPEQVTKEAQAGEALPKGAFMIRGKTNYLKPEMRIALGIYDDKVMAGPVGAVKTHCSPYIIVVQGDKKPSDIAKEIKKHLGFKDVDEIIRGLPSGECRIEDVIKHDKENDKKAEEKP